MSEATERLRDILAEMQVPAADMLQICLRDIEAELAASKATIKQMHKDYGFEVRDPCGTIWEEAARLQNELAAMTKEANNLEELKNHNAELLAASQARVKELEKEIGIVSNYRNCFSCEHYDAKMEECKDSNSECNYTPKVMYRCADRDDGCGVCERSEPHTHPDENPGDECYRRNGRVTCERV